MTVEKHLRITRRRIPPPQKMFIPALPKNSSSNAINIAVITMLTMAIIKQNLNLNLWTSHDANIPLNLLKNHQIQELQPFHSTSISKRQFTGVFSQVSLDAILVNLTVQSKLSLFEAFQNHFDQLNPNEVFLHFKECFTLSFSKKINSFASSLNRSMELANFSYQKRPMKSHAIEENPELIDRVRHSGSMYAFSKSISEKFGVHTLDGLKHFIKSLPVSWRGRITGLDLQNFNLESENSLLNLMQIVILCPNLVKVQFYDSDLPNTDFVNHLEKINFLLSQVKLRISA